MVCNRLTNILLQPVEDQEIASWHEEQHTAALKRLDVNVKHSDKTDMIENIKHLPLQKSIEK